MASKCVECGGHVPTYTKYLCEECWRVALNEKLNEDDKEKSHDKNSGGYRRSISY